MTVHPTCCSATESAPTPQPLSCSPPATTPNDSTARHPSLHCAGSAPSRHHRERHSAPAQPRRRPTGELCPLHDHHRAPAVGQTHTGLRPTTRRRGQDPPRGHPLPQALHRPRDLPRHRQGHKHATEAPIDRLTSIGASNATSSTEAPSTSPQSGSGCETPSPPVHGTRPDPGASRSNWTGPAVRPDRRERRRNRRRRARRTGSPRPGRAWRSPACPECRCCGGSAGCAAWRSR